MPTLTAMSLSRLATCHPDLQKVVRAVAMQQSIMVICGHRGAAEQEEAYAAGTSKEHWPHSRHNSYPSEAVDLAPLPLDWTDVVSFDQLAQLVKKEADALGVALEWGGDFPHLVDRPHFQLSKKPIV